ncbi:hypothetical protein J1614_008279 [Plenodomus biglobosus]|nr:hypothetical protein J1614_008279 [Plenodomus biglobosus]
MAKRKTAPTDSPSVAKKIKPSQTAANTELIHQSAPKAAVKLDAVKAVDNSVTSDAPAVATVDASTTATTNISVTVLNDDDEYEIDFDAIDDDGDNTTLVASDDDKSEKAENSSSIDKSEQVSELVVDKKATIDTDAAHKSDTASETIAITADVEKTLEEATITNAQDGTKKDQENSKPPSAAEEVVEVHSIDEWKAEYARQALINGLQTQFTYAPGMLSMAGASDIGDTIVVGLAVNGLKIEVSFKVVGLEQQTQKDEHITSDDIDANTTFETILDSTLIETTNKSRSLSIDTVKAQNALQTAPPLSANTLPTHPRAHIPCKFGDSCNKSDNCPFDHSVITKKKLCIWVNTIKGCTKGDNCHFSHDYEGKMCTKSTSRMTCENGATCAFKHNDDGAKATKKKTSKTSIAPPLSYYPDNRTGSLASSNSASIASLLSPGLLRNPANQDHSESEAPGSDYSYDAPINAPSGPRRLGKGAGQKRHVESEVNDNDAPRPRKHNNHHSQYQSQQQAGYTSSGPQNAQGGRKFAHPRAGRGHHGKNNGRGGGQHKP